MREIRSIEAEILRIISYRDTPGRPERAFITTEELVAELKRPVRVVNEGLEGLKELSFVELTDFRLFGKGYQAAITPAGRRWLREDQMEKS